VLVSDFHYHLPEDLIAQEPLEDRAASRMLVLHRAEGRWEDRMFREIPEYIQAGDVIVLNNSRVFPSRLFGIREGGTARVEVFLIRALSADHLTWQALVRPGRKLPVGEGIRFSETLRAEVLDRAEHGERTVRFDASAGSDIYAELDRYGHMPLPPYIHREDRPGDRARYNTVFATVTGSVAAPTAGLHFTPEVLSQCEDQGAQIARVTLHVGLGTFAPLHADTVEEVKLHSERYQVEPAQLEIIRSAKRRLAVGTTASRTLETVFRNPTDLTGDTDIFISPGYQFQAVDAMLTNFHLPQSSLMMLVSALAGREFILDAYQHAVQERYRFFSYGDCMLIL